MNLNKGLTVLGTFATAAAVTTVAAASPAPAAAAFTSYTGQATDNLNVRSTPDTNHAKIGTLEKGQTFEVIGTAGKSQKGTWLKIEYQNKTAYVDGYYVEKETQPATVTLKVQKVTSYQAATTANLNVRFLPSANGTVLTTLKKGTTVTVIGKTSDGWLQINYKNGSAYVSSKYIGPQEKASASASSASAAASVQAEAFTGVTTDNLNVRKGASTANTILTTLKKGSQVSVVGSSGNWLKIKYGSGYGWVSAQYVSKTASASTSSSTATVQYTGTTTGNLNVRSGASTNDKILTTLKKGSQVSVVGSSGNWLKIKYGSGYGWVSAQYISKTASASTSSSTATVQYTGTTTDDLNVRQSASTSATILTTLKKGSSVSVTGTSGSWLTINYNGKTAYVSAEYVQKQGTATQSGSGSSATDDSTTMGVISAYVNFRQSPSTSSKSYGVLNPGIVVEWLANGPDGWIKIGYNGQDGYVYGDYINKQTETQIPGDAAIIKTQYNISLASAVAEEEKVSSGYTSTEIAAEMNPNNFKEGTVAYYQFLKLSSVVNINASDLNKVLAGKGTLAGQGQAFINAANSYKINLVYLVAHACLETGNGSSSLAQGTLVNGKRVYNMFGISAFDGSAVISGSQYAYDEGWTTPAKAIDGGAQWIAKYYIYRSGDMQDTLYKMRWNPQALENGSAAHQYATDIGWAVNQTLLMSSLCSLVSGTGLIFDVPQYE